jgi:hypothetical protein
MNGNADDAGSGLFESGVDVLCQDEFLFWNMVTNMLPSQSGSNSRFENKKI